MKIISVVGARPNFVKIAPICRAFQEFNKKNPDRSIEKLLLHTGQHYDYNMSKILFEDLDIPRPDINLGIGSGTHAEQTAGIMVGFERVCIKEKPNMIIVVGDVNSTLACSIVAAKLFIPVAHVEAGLRSYDRTMPEEINRIVTDAISTHLFTTCSEADENLKKEGIGQDKIHFVGNVMIDSLYYCLPKAGTSNIKSRLDLKKCEYVLVTLHRPSNVDNGEVFSKLLDALFELSKKIKIVFPMHAHSKKMAINLSSYKNLKGNKTLRFIEPVGYIDLLNLEKEAKFVITDSGGIQEETTVFGVPCLTLRENTERPITVMEGTNILVGQDTSRLLVEADNILRGNVKKGKIPELWDGKTAERIVEIVVRKSKST